MKWTVLSLLLVSTLTFANEDRFAKRKAFALENVNARISMLEQSKSCINSAQKKEDLKKCREEGKAKRNSMKESFKAKRQAMKNSKS